MHSKTQSLKHLVISAILALLFVTYAHAQTSAPTMTIKKFVGENTAFLWDYPVEDEISVTEFHLRWIDDLTKTTIFLKAVPKNLRTTTISAAFTPGFKFTYYNIVAVVKDAAGTITWTSATSNTVANERVGRPPTNLRNQ